MSEIDKLFESASESKAENMVAAKSKKSDQNDVINSLIKKIEALEKKLEAKNVTEAGNPANEWAKKMAQEKASRQPKPFKTLYTQKDGKVLKVDVKTNGSYSSYIGNNRKHKDQLTPLILQWKKDGVWVDEYELDNKIKEIMSELGA